MKSETNNHSTLTRIRTVFLKRSAERVVIKIEPPQFSCWGKPEGRYLREGNRTFSARAYVTEHHGRLNLAVRLAGEASCIEHWLRNYTDPAIKGPDVEYSAWLRGDGSITAWPALRYWHLFTPSGAEVIRNEHGENVLVRSQSPWHLRFEERQGRGFVLAAQSVLASDAAGVKRLKSLAQDSRLLAKSTSVKVMEDDGQRFITLLAEPKDQAAVASGNLSKHFVGGCGAIEFPLAEIGGLPFIWTQEFGWKAAPGHYGYFVVGFHQGEKDFNDEPLHVLQEEYGQLVNHCLVREANITIREAQDCRYDPTTLADPDGAHDRYSRCLIVSKRKSLLDSGTVPASIFYGHANKPQEPLQASKSYLGEKRLQQDLFRDLGQLQRAERASVSRQDLTITCEGSSFLITNGSDSIRVTDRVKVVSLVLKRLKKKVAEKTAGSLMSRAEQSLKYFQPGSDQYQLPDPDQKTLPRRILESTGPLIDPRYYVFAQECLHELMDEDTSFSAVVDLVTAAFSEVGGKLVKVNGKYRWVEGTLEALPGVIRKLAPYFAAIRFERSNNCSGSVAANEMEQVWQMEQAQSV